MEFLDWLCGIGLVGYVIHYIRKKIKKASKERHEEVRRTDIPCSFSDGFTEYEFEQMVKKVAKRIRRISSVSVCGPIVSGVVQSQSGISEWEFELDFNDYGHITGTFWYSTDNSDSAIPERLGTLIQEALSNN